MRKFSLPARIVLAAALVCSAVSAQAAVRGKQHDEYARHLWNYLQQVDYTRWRAAAADMPLPPGPQANARSKTYLNRIAAGARTSYPYRSMMVTRHFAGEELVAVTVRFRVSLGYSAKTNDWYWAHFAPSGWLAKTSVDKNPFDKSGYVAVEEDGRLWVFREICANLADFGKHRELAKHVIKPGAGPGGMTIKGPDAETILEYLAAREGFVTHADDGRLWVFHVGSAELAEFKQVGELARHVIRPGAGPGGVTLKAADSATIDAYLTARPGFVSMVEDGRLWVFREDCDKLAKFKQAGELAKHVIRPGAGPNGMTLKAPDTETILGYLTAQEGFETIVEDERLWVFRAGSAELSEFRQAGELAKHVIRPGAGPMGMTLKAPDAETIDAYLRVTRLGDGE